MAALAAIEAQRNVHPALVEADARGLYAGRRVAQTAGRSGRAKPRAP
jgi:hypothetical protein